MSDQNDIIEATPFQRAGDEKASAWSKLNPTKVVVGIVFLMLFIAAAFMFTARAVSIITVPVADKLEVQGFYYELGGRLLMLPGEYSVKGHKAGFHPLATTFDVSMDAAQTFTFELKELPGKLSVTTEPSISAEVFIDQVAVGTTPLLLDEIEPGLHDVSIRSDRFLDFDTEITALGKRQDNDLVALLSPAWALIEISTNPEGAQISVEGSVLGTTPAVVEILQGYRGLEIMKDGYKTFETNLDVVAGVAQNLPNILLEKADGKISLTSKPLGANVTIDGRYRGQTPLSLILPPSPRYAIQLTKAGYEPFQRNITVKPEQDLALNEALRPILGAVRLSVEPSNSTVFIDGVKQTSLNQRVSLTAKPHNITISAPGFADYVATVTPQPGTTQQLVVRLQTEAEAAAAAIPTKINTGIGLAFNLIIPDKLTMGAGRREPGRRSNEIQKNVVMTKAYYLATTELTNLQYKMFDPGHDSGVLGRALLSDDDRPVVNVSWNDAAKFCNWLSQQEGLPLAYQSVNGLMQAVKPMNTGYRLPTEAEWAWAARYSAGPKPTRFPWGDTMPPKTAEANYADESAANMVPYHIEGYVDNFRGPSPVTQFPANEFGIHDLAGNVAEWIHDNYSLTIPKDQLTDPLGPDVGDYHVLRGSSYKHGRFSELRWTYRDYGTDKRADVGIRVARYLENVTTEVKSK